ncbi:hypothetical protein [Actibacterium sp. 188UL27-1]|uniref:hypothetical protein n=1 Tax=Actibacterium sp. 188UL27-1 TaxID=2786961 RepID=UPI001958B63D|nr:hypothetical protein [Actibacterium sp. 188UL27-1]MBM7067902.1 hypothetical protein [Actibacterium sp. 188UL27-1]
MIDDFAVLDFALLALHPARVAAALNALRVKNAEDKPASKGILTRLFRGDGRGPRPLLVHANTKLRRGPHARIDISANRSGSDLPIRISIAPGPAQMTLVEFIETEIGQSSVARGLSEQHPELEVFYFRYSGARHPGADFAFHVYQNGRALRRTSALSFKGAGPDANWTATDSGLPHPAETECLSDPETPRNQVMSPIHQGTILEALGIDTECLFSSPDPSRTGLVLSPDAGGSPIDTLPVQPVTDPSRLADESSLPLPPALEPTVAPRPMLKPVATPDPGSEGKLKAQPRRKIRTTGPPSHPPVPVPDPDPDPDPVGETVEAVHAPDDSLEPVQPVEMEPLSETASLAELLPASTSGGEPVPIFMRPSASEPSAEETAAPERIDDHVLPEPEPVEPHTADITLSDDGEASPAIPAIGTRDWETEVTRLLLDAVEAGLPPAEQVPWLDDLTKQLQAGEVSSALSRATALIERGNRQDDEKHRAIDRLTALYRAAEPPLD